MSDELILKKGKFWKNGNVVQPVIGDVEQIALVKKLQAYIDDLHNGLCLDIEITGCNDEKAAVYFDCRCEANLACHITLGEYDIPSYEFSDKVIICNKCKTKYVLFEEEEFRMLCVKIKK